jgi:cyclopropane fatty-acyl-phospholipid synthase-like methyltransferase
MQSVDPAVYNASYFEGRYQNINYGKLESLADFDHIYQKASALINFEQKDKIIDFGCGAGHLAFYLYLKYHCDVTGIDYSPDAINLSNKNLEILKNRGVYPEIGEKVRFLLSNNQNLPDFEGVRAVFLLDVLEHLNDQEIDFILGKIKKWGAGEEIQLVVHTDNNNYLRFVRPITDLLLVFFGKSTFKTIKEGKAEVAKGHINLTTARKLRGRLEANGFKVLKLKYPEINIDIVRAHLGEIGKIKVVLQGAFYLGKIFYFLRPSFYLLATSKN